jgi:hypothetical protein
VDRLTALLRRMPPDRATDVAALERVVALRREVAALPSEARLERLAREPALEPLVGAVRRGAAPYPESADPIVALAAEALRVEEALHTGAPARFDRLLERFAAAGASAASCAALWGLVPAFVARHAELGLARAALRPLLGRVLDEGPLRSFPVGPIAQALERLDEDDLAERAARRAALEGDRRVLAERRIRQAFRVAAERPEQALRLLDHAAELQT